MNEFEQAYADAANLSALTKPRRRTVCGAIFAVIYA